MIIDINLKAANISKTTAKGKIDFHACRVAYITHILDSGAKPKEAQNLAIHSDLKLTMNIYARTFDERLVDITETLGETILGKNDIIFTEQKKGGDVTD